MCGPFAVRGTAMAAAPLPLYTEWSDANTLSNIDGMKKRPMGKTHRPFLAVPITQRRRFLGP